MGSKSKTLTLLFILVFASLYLLPYSTVEAQTKTLVVPDPYPTIQDAINNAHTGDTIYVHNGTYYEIGLEIDKPLTLIGQNPDGTIIDDNTAGDNPYYSAPILTVAASNVKIEGFTLTGSEVAIEINSGNGIKIIGNNIVDNNYLDGTGIIGGNGNNLVISENNITNNYNAMGIGKGNNLLISHNTITDNANAIGVNGGENGVISDNTISNNSCGIAFEDTSKLNIYGNNISDNMGGYGLEFLWNCSNSVVRDNNIEDNSIGVNLQDFESVADNVRNVQGSGNEVYQNNFINNTVNANVENQYLRETTIVSWDNGVVGNYWSDYNGSGTYVVNQNNVDHHPLTQRVNISNATPTPNSTFIETFQLLLIATVTITVVASLLLLFKRLRKTPNLKQ